MLLFPECLSMQFSKFRTNAASRYKISVNIVKNNENYHSFLSKNIIFVTKLTLSVNKS